MPQGLLSRNPDFRRYWAGDAISRIGSQVTFLALPTIAILRLDASAIQVGLLQALQFLPFLPLGMLAGAWLDRRRRRPIMIGGDIGRMLVLSSIPVASALGRLTLVQLYLVALLVGTLNVVTVVAYQSYLPGLLNRDDLVEGNARLQLTTSAAAIGGPVLAGGLIELVGPATAITADGLSFMLCAVAIALIRRPEPRHDAGSGDAARRGGLADELREGLNFVFRHPVLKITTVNAATVNFGNYLTYTILIVFAYRELHLPAGEVGAILGLGSVGFVISALGVSRASGRLGTGRTLTFSNVIVGLGLLSFPAAQLANPSAVLTLAQLVVAVGWPSYLVTQQGLRQAITPSHLRGRMNGVHRTVTDGITPVASFASGALGSAIGIAPTLALGGSITLLSTVLLLAGGVNNVRLHDTPAPPARAPVEGSAEPR